MRNSSIRSVKKSGSYRKWLVAVLAALPAVVITSCNFGPSRVQPPSIDAGDSADRAMEMYDADGDGYIAADELDKAPSLKASLATLDTDKDGKVSDDEIEARIEAWQATRIGIAGVLCILKMDGKPLAGARLDFEPETFLGGAVQASDGVSDFTGAVFPRIPKEKRPTPDTPGGMQLGFYRVRVSKIVNGKETIPAKYNSATTLGQQIAPDDPEVLKQKIVIDLKSN